MRVTHQHRNEQQGTIGEYDANGFAEFHSATGARFTVHASEVYALDASPATKREARARWAIWPLGDHRIAVERPAVGEPSLIVARL